MESVLLAFALSTLLCVHAALEGLPFSSSLAEGQAVLLPKCETHVCLSKNDSAKGQLCSCRDDCYKQRDCCLDALSDGRVAELFPTDLWTCIRTSRGHGPYVAIGRCPSQWTDQAVKQGCEGPIEVGKDHNRALPVRSTKTNNTYRNIYCGQCNEGELQPGQFQLRFRCTGGENVTSVPAALAEANCDAHVEAAYCTVPEKTVHNCSSSWRAKNSTYDNEVRWRCATYFAPVTINGTRFKNAFCAICNNMTWKLDDVSCHTSFYPVEKEFILRVDGEFNSGTLIPGGGGKLCKPGEVYDPFKKDCRRVICANASDCNATSTKSESESPTIPLSSPCNMSLFESGNFKMEESTGSVTVSFENGKEETYSKGEYDLVSTGAKNGSVLVCKRIEPETITLFPQHFCERRRLLGYGSCGCEVECIQSRACCLDALDDVTMKKAIQQGGDAWVCLNDSRRAAALSKCPIEFPDRQIRNQCENIPDVTKDPLLHVPVFAWDSTTLYRNVFCAVCNGVNNVTFYDVRFLCQEHVKAHNGYEAAEVFLQQPETCTMSTEAGNPDLPLKRCVEDPSCLLCPSSWGTDDEPRKLNMRWRCEHHYAPVDINGTCYRNDFCAYCNNVNPMDSDNRRIYADHMMKPVVPQRHRDTFSTFTVG